MLFKKWKLVLATSALLVGGTVGFAAAKGHRGEAFAARHAQRKAEMLQKHDANQNGVLDPAERQAMKAARAEARFAKLDKNGDGMISRAEFAAGHQGRRGGMKQRP